MRWPPYQTGRTAKWETVSAGFCLTQSAAQRTVIKISYKTGLGLDFIAAGLTDVGLLREVNEDSYSILPGHKLFLVADGMGGHKAGDIASQLATTTIASFFRETDSGADQTWPFHFDPHRSTDENRLLTSVKLANRRIFDASVRSREVQGMGTTVVGALFEKRTGRLYVAHVGDSRAYRFRDGQLAQITKDHSLLNDYLSVMPFMTEEQRAELPSNVITRALGMQETVEVDVCQESPLPGDIYLLCSDGLSGMVTDEEMATHIERQGSDPEALVKTLVELANRAGGEDNITVVVVAFSGEPGDVEVEADTDAALKIARLEEAKTLVPDEEPTGRSPDQPTLADD